MKGSSGAGGVGWVGVKAHEGGLGDVATGLPIHWCRGGSLARQGEGRYSVRLVGLGRDDVSETKGTGRGGLDVCERQPGIAGDKTWHLTKTTDQRRPLVVLGVLADKGTLVRILGRTAETRPLMYK